MIKYIATCIFEALLRLACGLAVFKTALLRAAVAAERSTPAVVLHESLADCLRYGAADAARRISDRRL